MAERVDLGHLGPLSAAVVARVIHATADLDYAGTLEVDEHAAQAGIDALRRGAPVITDVEMVRCGIPGVNATCHLRTGSPGEPAGSFTRSAAGIRAAAAIHPVGAVFVIGCAPTALEELTDLHERGVLDPALVVGTPVGFVGAAESKARARASAMTTITNVGEKGGSAVAAAIVNALARLAR